MFERLQPLLPTVNSKLVNPVIFPPGRARFGTKPLPIGSITCTKTIGGRFSRNKAATTGVLVARIRSGPRLTSSAASLGRRLPSRGAHRYSSRTFLPSVQPRSRSPASNALTRISASGSLGDIANSTPTNFNRLLCCACAASGHAAAVPPRNVMKSRRLRSDVAALILRCNSDTIAARDRRVQAVHRISSLPGEGSAGPWGRPELF
jgi:hypothetical protein